MPTSVGFMVRSAFAICLLAIVGCGEDLGAPVVGVGGANQNPNMQGDVCAAWRAARVDLSEGVWTGNTRMCEAGTMAEGARANALRLVNFYRALAELSSVTESAAYSSDAQQCALIMSANGRLSHNPDAQWNCFSQSGLTGAMRSNIALTTGVEAVDLYMLDPGNETTLGHRRWILSNGLGAVGFGSTDTASCLWVFDQSGSSNRAWTAYPPPGPFPFDAVDAGTFTSLNGTGWSVQSDTLDLAGARVTVTSDGEQMPMDVRTLMPGFGSSSAISMIPRGWVARAGARYHVEITGAGPTIEYDVDMVACGP